MILAKISVSGVQAVVTELQDIPKGIIGGQIQLEYTDPVWEDLNKTVVFHTRWIAKDIVNPGEQVEIPSEVVSRSGEMLYVGIYGTDGEDMVAIPTVWTALGVIRGAADPSGDVSTNPALPVWAQLQEQINELKDNSTNPGDGVPGTAGEDGGYYTPSVFQPRDNKLQFDFTPSKADMPAVASVQVKLPIPDSGGNVDYVLPVGGDELGGVKNGGNVVINADGTMTAPESTKLPVANTAALGGVKPTVAKSAVMTQPVAVDENGGMWTTAAASGTVLVAASDAPDTIKAAAQYVCTGVNDQLMINAAIETVGEGEVRLSGGNFYLTGGIIPKDKIILYGRNSVLNVCDEISSMVTQAYTAGDTVIHVADASVFVVGQKVSTDANLASTYPCFIIGIDTANNTVTLDKALSTLKGFDANTYRLIADFTVVHCDGLSNVTVEGLIINGNSDSYGFYDTDRGSNGILFMSCVECKAINCTMNKVKCHGILVYCSTQCQVLNCVVDSCPRLGIDIYGAPGGHLIHGCIAKNCPSTGIQGHNVVNTIFSNCTATNCGTGISAQEGPNNVVIIGCELYSNRYGIKCIAAGAKTLNIVGNTILSSAADGIQLDATNAIDLCVSHNIIKDSGQKAIWLLGANGFSIVGNHIGNSYAANTVTTITDNAAIAIYGAAKNGYVADNNIILTTSDTKGCACGIAECSFTGDKNVVVNNVIRGARIAATQKLGANSKFENNYEF